MAALAMPLTQGLRVDARFGRFAGVTAAVSAVLQVQTAFEGVAPPSTLLLAAVLIGAAWGISRGTRCNVRTIVEAKS